MSGDAANKLGGIIGALFLTCLIAGAFSLSGCAQPASGDEIERAGKAAVEKALGELDKPQESAAPPVEVGPPPEPFPDSDPVKYMPPPDQTRRVLLFTDTTWCVPCRREKDELDALEDSGMTVGKAEGMDVKVIEAQEQTKGVPHSKWHQQFKITALPTFVLLVDGVETDRHVGYMTAAQIREFHGNAPEVATQRPFAEAWRQELARKHGRRAMGAHTDLDAETVALPEARINLRQQCVEFSGPSRVSPLNRWFSVSFGAGSVSHSGSTVTFSNPPELRFHLLAGGAGEKLDSLRAIEFTSDGAAFRMTLFGTIRFKVK